MRIRITSYNVCYTKVITQLLGDAVEIADAIAIGIHKTARVDLVGDRLFPPTIAYLVG